MKRRTLLAAAGTTAMLPSALFAQAKRVYRIAIFDEASKDARPHEWKILRDRLGELGFADGKTAVYEARFGQGRNELLPALAAELAAGKPDIIVCAGTPSARAAMKASTAVPIVFVASGDAVAAGLVASLSRPGGNVTGFSAAAPETTQKILELLLELSPGLKRIAFLSDASNPAVLLNYARLEETARALKLEIQMLDGVGRAALERSFAAIKRDRVQAMIVGAAGSVLDQRDQIVQFAARQKIPAGFGRREYVQAGGLLFYGVDRQDLYQRAAGLVQRILNGAKPAEIPVEQVSVIRTVINLKAARALGLKIPESVRLRADEVIE